MIWTDVASLAAMMGSATDSSGDLSALGRHRCVRGRTSILKSPATRPKVAAGLLAIFLGGLGIHKFYLGITGAGLIMLLLSLFGCIVAGIPTFIISVIAIIEGIIYLTIYLTKSDEDFYETYEIGKKSWF
jgi:TM2 domain-containing membrane protein YozV